MTTPAELMSIYSSQSQLSSFFTDKIGIYSIMSYANKETIYDGITSATTALTNCITAAAITGGIVMIPTTENGSTYIIDDDITFPTNVSLWSVPGALLSISSGKILTINGGIDSGHYQIFSGSGIVLGSPLNEWSSPHWFGITEDGATDASPSIQKAIALGNLQFRNKASIYMASTVQINNPQRIIDGSMSSFTGASGVTMFQYGTLALTASLINLTIKDMFVIATNGCSFCLSYNSYFITFENIRITGLTGSNFGAKFVNGFNVSFKEFNITGASSGESNVSGNLAKGIWFEPTASVDSGVQGTNNLTNILVDSCLIQRVNVGIEFTTATSTFFDTNRFSNVGFSHVDTAVKTESNNANLNIDGIRVEYSDLAFDNDTGAITINNMYIYETNYTFYNQNGGIITLGSSLQHWNPSVLATTGIADAYISTYTTPYTSYTGMEIRPEFNISNTGVSTINVDGLGIKTIKKVSGGSLIDLVSGDIVADENYLLKYNGTYFILYTAGYLIKDNTSSTISFKDLSYYNLTSKVKKCEGDYGRILQKKALEATGKTSNGASTLAVDPFEIRTYDQTTYLDFTVSGNKITGITGSEFYIYSSNNSNFLLPNSTFQFNEEAENMMLHCLIVDSTIEVIGTKLGIFTNSISVSSYGISKQAFAITDTDTSIATFNFTETGITYLYSSTVNTAQGTLSIVSQPIVGDTMTIGAKDYIFTTDGTASVDGEIDIGADLADARTLIVSAINGSDGINLEHPLVVATDFVSEDCIITALDGGIGGNSIITTETFNGITNVFDATTLGTTRAGIAGVTLSNGSANILNYSYVNSNKPIELHTKPVILIPDGKGSGKGYAIQ